MRVFVTGATGFIGSAVVKELIAAGHQVIGLCRSDDKAPAAGRGRRRGLSRVDRGPGQPEGRRRPSRTASSISPSITTSRNSWQNCEDDRRVIEALGSALAGSDRPLIVTSGTAIANTVPGQPAEEDNATVGSDAHPRAASEEAAAAVAADGRQRVGGAPSAGARHGQAGPHHPGDRDRTARRASCAYIGDGLQPLAGGACARCRPSLQAGDRKGRAEREVSRGRGRRRADARHRRSHRPAPEAAGQIHRARKRRQPISAGLRMFAGLDMPASSAQTRRKLGWRPTGPGLIADLEQLRLADS